ncbi:MAG: sensor histidine kinase [Candidatus Saccharimonadaceae bacterium]
MQTKLSINSNNYLHDRTTPLILHGSFIAIVILGTLLISYNGFIHSIWLEDSTWVIVAIISYLLVAEYLLRKEHQQIVNWMLITFYVFLAFSTLLLWGLNAPVGILTVSFAVILPSILMGARSILPVTCLSILTLVIVQLLHNAGVSLPNLQYLSLKSTFWDVATYSTILSIFALVSWLSVSQREKSLRRALHAESALKVQKDILADELEKESAALRLAQLNQVRHLHRFALLGQSTAATLHELSNHLSVLNLDIDDLHQQHTNSKAISNAKDSINHINKMVRQARQQINSYDQYESFDAINVINQSFNDMNEKFKYHKMKLCTPRINGKNIFITKGSPSALMQIIAILLNNSFDATMNSKDPKVSIEIKTTKLRLYVSIKDNGTGVDPTIANSLFTPVTSTKNAGLGVGLYIAYRLANDYFGGNITLSPSKKGACFILMIPANKPMPSS